MSKINPMRDVQIEKLVVHSCIGGEGDEVVKLSRVLQQLTDQTPTYGKSRLTVRQFGIRRGQNISAKVTVRGEKAQEILEKALRVVSYELPESAFTTGQFGFGIKEHIDLGIKYDPSSGIYGMDFIVVLSRPGKRVSQRKHCQDKIGHNHYVSKEDAIKFAESMEIKVTPSH